MDTTKRDNCKHLSFYWAGSDIGLRCHNCGVVIEYNRLLEIAEGAEFTECNRCGYIDFDCGHCICYAR